MPLPTLDKRFVSSFVEKPANTRVRKASAKPVIRPSNPIGTGRGQFHSPAMLLAMKKKKAATGIPSEPRSEVKSRQPSDTPTQSEKTRISAARKFITAWNQYVARDDAPVEHIPPEKMDFPDQIPAMKQMALGGQKGPDNDDIMDRQAVIRMASENLKKLGEGINSRVQRLAKELVAAEQYAGDPRSYIAGGVQEDWKERIGKQRESLDRSLKAIKAVSDLALSSL